MESGILDDFCGLNTLEKCSISENAEDCESLSKFSTPASPTLTEKSSKYVSELSKNGTKNLNGLKSESPIVKSSKNSIYISPKSINSFSGGKRDTDYKYDNFNRNPITWETTESMAKHSHYITAKEKNAKAEIDCRDIYRKCPENDKTVCESLNIKDLKKSYIRRNPITGEGMPDSNYQINMKNLLRSGLRIKQPPGGL